MNLRSVVPLLSLALGACGASSPSAPPPPPAPKAHGLALTVANSQQSAMAIYVLAQPMTVTVVDTFANTPVAGVVLQFQPHENGMLNGDALAALMDDFRMTTNASGQASVSWRLGRLVGAQTVDVNVVSSPIAMAARVSTVMTATATTPHFLNSNVGYGYNNIPYRWDVTQSILDYVAVNIPADTEWSLDSVRFADVLDSATVSDSLVFTVDSVQWEGTSAGALRMPTCTLNGRMLTCPHGNVGYLEPGRTDVIDVAKPYRMGEFWLKLSVRTKSGAPVSLHHLKSDGVHETPTGYWLRVGTFGIAVLS